MKTILLKYLISLVDYNLSDMKGIEFVERAKECNRFQGSDIDGLQWSGSREIEEILKAGITDVILSPFASAKNIKRVQDKFPLPPWRRLRALVVDDSPTIVI